MRSDRRPASLCEPLCMALPGNVGKGTIRIGDEFGLISEDLVNVFQKLVDLRFRVADLRTLAEQRGQRFFQLCNSAHGNSSNHFSDAAFSGQGGYAPQ